MRDNEDRYERNYDSYNNKRKIKGVNRSKKNYKGILRAKIAALAMTMFVSGGIITHLSDKANEKKQTDKLIEYAADKIDSKEDIDIDEIKYQQLEDAIKTYEDENASQGEKIDAQGMILANSQLVHDKCANILKDKSNAAYGLVVDQDNKYSQTKLTYTADKADGSINAQITLADGTAINKLDEDYRKALKNLTNITEYNQGQKKDIKKLVKSIIETYDLYEDLKDEKMEINFTENNSLIAKMLDEKNELSIDSTDKEIDE